MRLLRPRKLVDQGEGPVDAILPVRVLNNVLAGFRILRHARLVHNRPESFEACHLSASLVWDGTSLTNLPNSPKGLTNPRVTMCLSIRHWGGNTASRYANHLRMVLVFARQLLPRARALPPSKAEVELSHVDDAHHASIVRVVAFTKHFDRR